MTKICWKWKFLNCRFPNAFPPVWQWAAWASFAICVGGSNLGGRRRSADCSPPLWARSCSSSSKLLTPTYQGWGVDCDEVVAGLFIGDKAAASSVPFLRRQVLGWDAMVHSKSDKVYGLCFSVSRNCDNKILMRCHVVQKESANGCCPRPSPMCWTPLKGRMKVGFEVLFPVLRSLSIVNNTITIIL